MPHILDPITETILDTPLIILVTTAILIFAGLYEVFGLRFWVESNTHRDQLIRAKALCFKIIDEKSCAPILVRLAWHDSATYDKSFSSWPEAGGAIGSIRTLKELESPGAGGLLDAIATYLSPIKEQCPLVSWADLIQMASACGIEASGGPCIAMRYGRLDGVPVDFIERNFSEVTPPFPIESDTEEDDSSDDEDGVTKKKAMKLSEEDPVGYIKHVFGRLGLTDQETVALFGAHTLGRAFIERSGHVSQGYRRGTKFTSAGCPYLKNSETIGGKSWTRNWLVFDNSYYVEIKNHSPEDLKNLNAFPTDLALSVHPDFKPFFDRFATSQEDFFECYQVSHKKMSELGSKFSPPEGIVL